MSFIKSIFKSVAVFFIAIFIIIFLIALAMPSEQETNDMMQDFQTQVAEDFEQQYNLAKTHGSIIDRCVRAGLVAEGYLQADKELEYQKWKLIEQADCRAAGVPI